MTRLQVLTTLLVVGDVLSGCSGEPRGADEAVDPVRATPTATPSGTPPTSSGDRWACPDHQVYGFTTDPVVYPADLSLAEVASRLEGTDSHIDSNSGRLATVTIRNREGLIVRRLGLERSKTVGWHVERGRAC